MKRAPTESSHTPRDGLRGIPRRISSAEPRAKRCKPRRIGARFTKSGHKILRYGKDDFIKILTYFAGAERELLVRIRRPLE